MKILQPAYTATEFLSGSKYPTQGGLCLVIGGLQKHLERQSDALTNAQWQVGSAIKDKLDAYWTVLTDAPSILRALLDPRTKLSSFETDSQEPAITTLETYFKLYKLAVDNDKLTTDIQSTLVIRTSFCNI